MNANRLELLLDLAWVTFAGGYCAVSASYPPGGRMVPLTVGLVALAIGIVHFCGNFLAVLRPLTHGEKAAELIERNELVAASWGGALLAGIFIVGAIAAVFLFFLLYFGLRGRRWLLGLGSAVVMTLLTWGLFGQVIAIDLPTGWLTAWLQRLF